METMPAVLSCSAYLHVNKPIADVYEAVVDNTQLNKYFATGVASGRLEEGDTVYWSFHDFPDFGPFPVKVIKCDPPSALHLQWESSIEGEWTDIHITLEAVNEARTLVRVTESGWPPSPKGIKSSVDNCGGWTNMLDCLKAYLEHGILLRDF